MRIRITIALLFFTSFFVFAQNATDWYVGKPIKNITFEGLKHVKSSELEGVVEPYIGRIFDDDLFWELQGRIYALEYFDLIAPNAVPSDQAGTAVIIKFQVTEKPVVSRIEFEGNSNLRKSELLDVVTIKINDVVNTLKMKIDEQAVKDKYLERGYPEVSVKTEAKTMPDSSIALRFIIDEGEQLSIENFRFEGISAFSERTLRGLLSLKAKGFLNDGAFQESKLIADKEAITSYYKERGYVDAAVLDVVRESRKDDQGKNLLTIVFRINEGRSYLFGGISFEGNKIFTSNQLSDLVYLKEGQLLNGKRLEADFQRVADLYYENGYIFNTISRKEKRNEEEGTLSYLISIVERDRAHIENIIIRGNKKTKDSVILREIPLEPGDIFSKTKVIEGLRNLYNLQYFSAVNPETPPGSADNLMDLVFSVEEQPTADIQFGVTFSGTTSTDSFPVSGLVKWNDKNFLGRGNIFGIELNAATDSQYLSFQYTEKWLFGLPLSGGFDFTIKHSQLSAALDNASPYFNGDEDYAYPDGFDSYADYVDASYVVPDAYKMTYDQWNYSVGFSTGYKFLTPLGNLGLAGGLRTSLVKNYYDDLLYRPFDPTLRENNNAWYITNSIWSSISLDQRDIYYDPSKGYYGIQRLGYVGIFPSENEHYIKTDTKAEIYFTLWDIPITDNFKFKTVFGAHTGLSLIHPQFFDSEPTIESSNELYIDGMFTARGWISERSNLGLALWESWMELRTPIAPGILAFDWFFDAAAVKDTPSAMFNDLSMNDFRFSLGGGLRFTIPQFPFRFSLAKRFKVVDGEIEWQQGALWANSNSSSGLDFVLSFALSTY